MTIRCDRCEKEAHVKGCPEGVHWLDFLQDEDREAEAFLVLPMPEGILAVICKPCLEITVTEFEQQQGEEP